MAKFKLNITSMHGITFTEKIKDLPFVLISLIWVVAFIGYIALWSAAGGENIPWAMKQMKIFLAFFLLAILIATMDIKIIYKFAYHIYIIALLLLIAVELFGTNVMGAKRWVNLGLFKAQPSEPIKIAIILVLAKYFHQFEVGDLSKFSKIIVPIILVIFPVLLVIKQPDLGTAIIIMIIATTIFFVAGIDFKKFVIGFVLFLVSLPIVWSLLHDYQRKRILMFLDPEQDPLGAGYNIIQSQIAIGSGGVLGKGLTKGTQSHLSFLPEHQTDFIFASLAEEFGLVGCTLVLVLYAWIIVLSFAISVNCKSFFGKFLSIGVISFFSAHMFINIAMVMGVMPVVGVPLPLISYGGTMMGSMLIGFGLLMNVHINRNNRISAL